MRHKTLGEIKRTGLSVEEHDASRRIILNPITDENNYLVAVTGLIVDTDHFINTLLPRVISQSLPDFHDNTLWVCLLDRFGRQVCPGRSCPPVDPQDISRNFDFIFIDWTLSLQGRLSVPDRLARAKFAVNVTLSVALAVVLLGGIVFTVCAAVREMKLSAMKSEVVSNVSHELRTPLASIRVFGELMRHSRVRDTSKVIEYGTHIETESRRLSQLINNILDFSRIEAGRKIYSFERFHCVSTGLEHDVKGSGLDLSLVRHIVNAHGGRVRLESELGNSSAFFIHLPIDRNAGDHEEHHNGQPQGSDC